MPFDEEVYKWQRITLLRLVRAVSGAPAADSPPVDDRGWLHDPSASYTLAEVHGPVIGMTESKNAKVRLERIQLDPGAQLFVVSTNPAVVSIENPRAGVAVGADGSIELVASDLSDQGLRNDAFVKIEIHHGSAAGPMIFEFGVRIFERIVLNVQPHLLNIRGTLCTTNQARIDSLALVVNRIWRPAGLHFRFKTVAGHTVNRTTVDGTTTQYRTAGEITYNSSAAAVPLGAVAIPANYWDEFWDARHHDRAANHINLYFAHEFTNVGVAAANQHNLHAMTWAKDLDAADHGIVMKDGADGNDLAHELGHFLSLNHPDENAAGASVIESVDMLRRLMYSFNPYAPSRGFRANVGYGNHARGALITNRNKPRDTRDAEWNDARTRARNPF